MNKTLFILLLFLVFYSCKKGGDDINSDPDPIPPPDTTTFVIPQTEDIIMYEVNLRALSTTGDFKGVIDRLSEIKALGINVIWLMPIHPIGEINSVNSPYSVKNFKETNPEFGSMNDFKDLVKSAHDLEMAVIIDWVANHTAWDNPWINNKDWYTQDENGNIIHPPGTNWLDVADLNYSNEDMKEEMIMSMKYWVTNTDIDGFRCDAADMVPSTFWKQAITALGASTKKNLLLLAEGSRNDQLTAGFQMNYSWDFYNKLKQVFADAAGAGSLYAVHQAEYGALPNGKHKLRYATNHDESAWDATPMVLFNGEDGAIAASIIAGYMGGIPMVYGSQEVGVVTNVPFFSNAPVDWSQNPEMLQSYKEIFNFYKGSDALKKGSLLNYSNSDVVVFSRTFELEELLIIVNVRNRNLTYKISSDLLNGPWEVAFTGSTVTLQDSIDLNAYEYLVLIK